ncbi:TRAP transporter small permease [Rhodospirillum rubrum]|uniref:TRAP transporter small permease protein n=1 Tax=Rhodospirillum rubrum (strain ATCC 11170 / ATH 1.1.1 / DSM 467 / LMG 4362 / NCIMB 8255 / S1) TaxID=269796 RepID=Q2RS57_RHORT|nr:TRAP transporter small permease [Rhodospirillum rubrum]ABC23038.1 Tripartite ATP-independent periplasmic transporter, DctQ component [Rhodospirillum rubrum ATCC 11170]AEO48767.1 tripartite ATP-independent periplasmic transporter DctQ [Rhodospirillum rubrum F11]MBK5954665.1 TRAP transporter small permease [Rhodospirillum rubrum]QXG79022.1 TRAP transporter small permease [Rhodospirillum rubrum]HAQ01218.1 TRAP transporter small permease [Rhodospirillum rubrum]
MSSPSTESAAKDEALSVPISVERVLAALAMAAICLITFANVVVRYFTDVSLAFTEEFSIFLMVVMTLLGSSAAIALDRHIRITVLVDRLPAPLRRVTETLVWLATLAMLGVLVWYGGRLTYDQWRFEETSPALGYPQWLYTLWLPLLSAVMGLRVLGRLSRLARGTR